MTVAQALKNRFFLIVNFCYNYFSQSLMLSAIEHGLATIPAVVFVGYPDLIRRVLAIPEDKAVIIGISIGYPDLSVKVNHFKSSRKPISEVVYRGVE